MLVNQIKDEENDVNEARFVEDDSVNYQTANELFKVISKKYEYDINDKILTPRDLVILYENIDLDTKVTCYTDKKPRAPNQYVETVVYNDLSDSEGSDISDIYTKDDFGDLCMINNERIDFMNSIPSLENIVCHKHANLKLKTADFVTNYDKNLLFKDPYIKNQLKSMDIFDSFLPSTLLDYICCKRLDDDYNFYLDNVISYIQCTIEQLKCISNGDYLTGIAKEKWRAAREVMFENKIVKNMEVVKSVSIPLPKGDKSHNTVWDSVVHSEMNLRFLKNILERKIIFEIPKLIYGYNSFIAKHCNDTLIIHCKNDKSTNNMKDNEEERQELKMSFVIKCADIPAITDDEAHIISTKLLQTISNIKKIETYKDNRLALENIEATFNINQKKSNIMIFELENDGTAISSDLQKPFDEEWETKDNLKTDTINNDTEKYVMTGLERGSYEQYDINCTEEIRVSNTEELVYTIQRLQTQSPILEEMDKSNTKKKRSPTRVRIKSPYENKSHAIEEKKRKRLLEIRERREKRKVAMSKNSKVTKYKYGQGAIMPQASSSVTKLSITNKSFYDSIYGQASNKENKATKKHLNGIKKENSKLKNVSNLEESLDLDSTDLINPQISKDLSYYLDTMDTIDTQIQHTDEVMNADTESIDLRTKYKIPSTESLHQLDGYIPEYYKSTANLKETHNDELNLYHSTSVENIVPINTPTKPDENPQSFSIECRKSIDKLYDLMNKLVTIDETTIDPGLTKIISSSNESPSFQSENLSVLHNESDSTIYNQLELPTYINVYHKTLSENKNINTNVTSGDISKLPVTSKLQNVKFDERTIKKGQKISSSPKTPDNPLKAISQLLHKFDNVQKNKNIIKNKVNKKITDTIENKNNTRNLLTSKPLKSDKCVKNNIVQERISVIKPKDKKHNIAKDKINSPQQHKLTENKKNEKINSKKIAELIDEVKEMRGEAVRGPKQVSRLDNLALPKKVHVDPPNKEFRNKNEKNLSSRRNRNISQIPQRNNTVISQKNKHNNISGKLTRLKPTTTTMPSEEGVKRRSTSNSPDKRRSPDLRNCSPSRGVGVMDAASISKKKMVTAYVKNHFGIMSPPLGTNVTVVQKTRAPLIPTDIDLESLTSSPSAGEASLLGSNLHYMVNTVINMPPVTLDALTECDETNSQLSKASQDVSRSHEILSASDFPIDVFQDKNIVTAVANTSDHKNMYDDSSVMNRESGHILKSNNTSTNSLTELEKLQNALNGHITNDTFRNKLRIKNLTPKQSMQHVFVLQSGDTGSLVVESTLSQKIHSSNSDLLSKIHTMGTLSKSRIDWNCKKLPIHCFPVFQSIQYNDPIRLVKQRSHNFSVKAPRLFEKTQILHNCVTKSDKIICMTSKTELNKNITPDVILVTSDEKKNNEIDWGLTNKDNNDKVDSNNSGNETDTASAVSILDKSIKKQSENINNTTSMDVLVGLLNEIKKISTYHSNIQMKKVQSYDNDMKDIPDIRSGTNNNVQKEISVNSLDKLRQLESNPSIYSCYISSNDGSDINNGRENINLGYIRVDKEVTANIADKECIHRFTEMPSRLLPDTSKQRNTACNSLCAITNKTSNQSKFPTKNYEIIYQNSLFNVPVHSLADKNKQYIKTNKLIKINQIISKKDLEIDPQIKFKRDILVTLYSILVITVFAALSLPDIIYFI